MVYRFADPVSVHVTLHSLSEARRALFLGPVAQVLWATENLDKETVWWLYAGERSPNIWEPLWQFTPQELEEMNTIRENTFIIPEMYWYFAPKIPLFQPMPQDEVYAEVERIYHMAVDSGLQSVQEIYTFAVIGMSLGFEVFSHPKIIEIFRNPDIPHGTKIDTALQLKNRGFWEEIRQMREEKEGGE